ncbi:MAG: hypothetical protein FWE41_08650 [Coriobacteriia bacterium]|nr:hypothetical protein [Coriobacteriia bacterium]
MFDIEVHPNALKHSLSEEDVVFAWENFLRKQRREVPDVDQMIAIGFDRRGNLIELVAIDKPYGTLIYHAKSPPTAKMLIELGMAGK